MLRGNTGCRGWHLCRAYWGVWEGPLALLTGAGALNAGMWWGSGLSPSWKRWGHGQSLGPP